MYTSRNMLDAPRNRFSLTDYLCRMLFCSCCMLFTLCDVIYTSVGVVLFYGSKGIRRSELEYKGNGECGAGSPWSALLSFFFFFFPDSFLPMLASLPCRRLRSPCLWRSPPHICVALRGFFSPPWFGSWVDWDAASTQHSLFLFFFFSRVFRYTIVQCSRLSYIRSQLHWTLCIFRLRWIPFRLKSGPDDKLVISTGIAVLCFFCFLTSECVRPPEYVFSALP